MSDFIIYGGFGVAFLIGLIFGMRIGSKMAFRIAIKQVDEAFSEKERARANNNESPEGSFPHLPESTRRIDEKVLLDDGTWEAVNRGPKTVGEAIEKMDETQPVGDWHPDTLAFMAAMIEHRNPILQGDSQPLACPRCENPAHAQPLCVLCKLVDARPDYGPGECRHQAICWGVASSILERGLSDLVPLQQAMREVEELSIQSLKDGPPTTKRMHEQFDALNALPPLTGKPEPERQEWEKALERNLPPHLRAAAPFLVCSSCGRKTWAIPPATQLCGMSQPNGEKCQGMWVEALERTK